MASLKSSSEATEQYTQRSLKTSSQKHLQYQQTHAFQPQHQANSKKFKLLSLLIAVAAFITSGTITDETPFTYDSSTVAFSNANAPVGAISVNDVPAAVGPQFTAPKTLVDAALFQDLGHYAGYPMSAFTQPCDQNLPFGSAVVEGYVDVASSDTQATLYREDSTKEFILAFPGSQSIRDILTDVFFVPFIYFGPDASDCHGCLVHSGFQLAWGSARDAVVQIVTEAREKHPTYELNVAGFSLGGALAHLAFLDLVGSNISVSNVYTYAEPRIGNQPFADFTDLHSGTNGSHAGIFHRVTHADDGVTQSPPPSWGFAHCGTEYWELDDNSTDSASPTAGTTYRCFGQEASDCNASQGRFGTISDAHFNYAGFDKGRSFCH